VRGDKHTGPVTLGATNGIDHGANGTFSICAGDMDDLALTKSDIQFRDESPDVF
jgi:hypothetical protein